MVGRRQFLGALTAAVAGASFDPERLLWVPGQKTIFLPPASKVIEFPTHFITDEFLKAMTKAQRDLISISGTYDMNFYEMRMR